MKTLRRGLNPLGKLPEHDTPYSNIISLVARRADLRSPVIALTAAEGCAPLFAKWKKKALGRVLLFPKLQVISPTIPVWLPAAWCQKTTKIHYGFVCAAGLRLLRGLSRLLLCT